METKGSDVCHMILQHSLYAASDQSFCTKIQVIYTTYFATKLAY